MPRTTATDMDSRLPFNSPDMGNPMNQRRGMLTRSAAKALRDSNRQLLSSLSPVDNKSNAKTNSRGNNAKNLAPKPAVERKTVKFATNNKQVSFLPDSEEESQVMTPPRKQVLFAEQEVMTGTDKENGSRRTRAGTPYRPHRSKTLPAESNENEAKDDGNAYCSMPSITVEDASKSASVTTKFSETSTATVAGSASSMVWGGAWVLHVTVLVLAAYWLMVEAATSKVGAMMNEDDVPTISMDP